MELAQEGHSPIGDGHAKRAFIEKKIFNPSLKHRQRQRWKVLPGQKKWSREKEERRKLYMVY